MPRINAEEVKALKQKSDRREYVSTQIKGCAKGDPIQLSDLLVNAGDWGGSALVSLGDEYQDRLQMNEDQMLWKLKVLRDEWGNVLAPGDKITKKIQKSLLDKNKQPIKPNAMSHALQDGSYQEQFFRTKEFKIDEKGCITCNFDDAVHFLNLWGLHQATNRALTTKKQTSSEPLRAPNGQMLHCHYWRFREMNKEQYEKLPKLEKRTDPLRGLEEAGIVEMFDEEEQLRKEIEKEKRKQAIIAIIAEAKGESGTNA